MRLRSQDISRVAHLTRLLANALVACEHRRQHVYANESDDVLVQMALVMHLPKRSRMSTYQHKHTIQSDPKHIASLVSWSDADFPREW